MNAPLIKAHRLAPRTPAVACVSTPKYFICAALEMSSIPQRLLSDMLFHAFETNHQQQKQHWMMFSLTRNAIQYP